MKRKSMPIAGVTAAAVAAAVLAGCSDSSGEASNAPVSIRLYDQIGSLDPALTAGGPGYQMSMFLYDRLVLVQDDEIVPYVAESWESTPLAVTFTIRDGVTCDDGSLLTASAVEASLERALDPATKSPLAAGILPSGTTFASDDATRTVTVTAERPDAALVLSFANPVLSIVCPAGLKNPEELASRSFGTGPYTLGESVTGTSYALTKRDDYTWGPVGSDGAARPASVTAEVLSNETTAANVFLQGKLDLISATSQGAVERLRGSGAEETAVPNAFAFVLFNQASPVGADPVVRAAVAHAIDPAAYAIAVQGDVASPSPNLLASEATICAQTEGDVHRPAFDPEKARRVLEGDGWRQASSGTFEKNGEPLRIRVGSHNQEGSAGAYLAQTLKDLGATVEATEVELPAYIETLQQGDWDVFAATIISLDAPAPLGQSLFGPEGLDLGQIRNDEFSQAMTEASSAAAFEESCELWKDAQDRLVESVDVVPEAHMNLVYFANDVTFDVGYAGLVEPTTLARR